MSTNYLDTQIHSTERQSFLIDQQEISSNAVMALEFSMVFFITFPLSVYEADSGPYGLCISASS